MTLKEFVDKLGSAWLVVPAAAWGFTV